MDEKQWSSVRSPFAQPTLELSRVRAALNVERPGLLEARAAMPKGEVAEQQCAATHSGVIRAFAVEATLA